MEPKKKKEMNGADLVSGMNELGLLLSVKEAGSAE